MESQKDIIINIIRNNAYSEACDRLISNKLTYLVEEVIRRASTNKLNEGYVMVKDIIDYIRMEPGIPDDYPRVVILVKIENQIMEMRNKGYDIKLIENDTEILYRIKGEDIEKVLREYNPYRGTNISFESD